MPKVSVIVPAYNVEPFLKQALDSLQAQTLRDMEFVCVNDGSTDGTLAMLRQYQDADPRFVVIDKPNGGYGVAMNVGMERATGDYIGILEPDDFVLPDMFRALYETAAAHDLDFVKADFYRFATTQENGNVFLEYNHLDKSGEWYGKVVDPSTTPMLTKFIMNTWSGIYKRSFLEENGIRHHETPGAAYQDNGFFWQTFIYAKRAMFLKQPFYMNRRDNPGSSVNNPAKVYAMNAEYDWIRDILLRPENRDKWELFKGYFHLKRYGNYLFTVGRIAPEYRWDYVERISREYKRAADLGELDLSLFDENSRKMVTRLMRNPKLFYEKNAKNRSSAWASPEQKALAKARRIEKSTNYRVGAKVLYIPRKIRGAWRRLKKHF